MTEKSRGFWHLPEGFWRLPSLKRTLILLLIIAVGSVTAIIHGNSDQIMQGNPYRSRALREIIDSLYLLLLAFFSYKAFFNVEESHLWKWFFGIGGVMLFPYSIWKLVHHLPTLLGGN